MIVETRVRYRTTSGALAVKKEKNMNATYLYNNGSVICFPFTTQMDIDLALNIHKYKTSSESYGNHH